MSLHVSSPAGVLFWVGFHVGAMERNKRTVQYAPRPIDSNCLTWKLLDNSGAER